MTTQDQHVSVFRLRTGVVLFCLWWLPAYLLAPVLAELLGSGTDASSILRLTICIMIAQTVIGLIGVLFAGKEIMRLRHIPYKKLPKTVWRLFWRGAEE